MLKYIPEDISITFAEIPDEICLCINITNCPHRCSGCHSQYLQIDIGSELTEDVLNDILNKNNGVTCVVFMGGDSDKESLKKLGAFIKSKNLKSAWYSGESSLPIESYKEAFDYIKIGPYIKERGPLNVKTTNQRMYNINNNFEDITYKFWR
jgi:anaerobic ribonucleoside-triphosphate reductase activating protein